MSTLLLAHGFSSSVELSWGRTGWLDILRDMGHTVVAPDMLGHGDAPKPHDPAAYTPGVEQRLLDALDEAGVPADEPVSAVGFSMGARSVLVLAAQHPGRFDKLIAAGVGANLFRPHDDEMSARVAQVIEEGRDDADVDPLLRAFARAGSQAPNDPMALGACMRRVQPPLGPAELASITIPVEVVVGGEDVVAVPPDQLVEALPHARLHTIPRTDHLGTMKSMKFLDIVVDWMGGL